MEKKKLTTRQIALGGILITWLLVFMFTGRDNSREILLIEQDKSDETYTVYVKHLEVLSGINQHQLDSFMVTLSNPQ